MLSISEAESAKNHPQIRKHDYMSCQCITHCFMTMHEPTIVCKQLLHLDLRKSKETG